MSRLASRPRSMQPIRKLVWVAGHRQPLLPPSRSVEAAPWSQQPQHRLIAAQTRSNQCIPSHGEYAAAQNASALGVNPDALAATCVVESGCRNVYTANSNSSITGAFQMSNGTYNEALQKALASNPSLASTITNTGISGQQDPATQAVAAAQYLKDAATTLQNAGISNPTALDARAYYNFGPTAGQAIARATDDTPMSEFVSASHMASNGISSNETVGQWRANVASKMGSAASSPILSS
ncbi:hypothetical protein S1001342_02820 (plasmid) [Acetobacter pasteurianus subsp. pasteurianus]|uniref:Transglycosylase SLT domain-containing protein n=1 Tax=Acetobacter pasteurianus subsp. pasteurianus TaxID=481145 RepID=A0A1Y0Y1M7_ACEPA|nr:hypothetical protein S1001342_02820 [Acetobacter pasteurianus subsp. pasteurianus]